MNRGALRTIVVSVGMLALAGVFGRGAALADEADKPACIQAHADGQRAPRSRAVIILTDRNPAPVHPYTAAACDRIR